MSPARTREADVIVGRPGRPVARYFPGGAPGQEGAAPERGRCSPIGLHPTLSLGIHPFVDRSFRALQKIEEAE
jgi:hypothetical protein